MNYLKGMEQKLLSKAKQLIYNCIIVREWIENGEFTKSDRIIVIGTRLQAVMISCLFKGSGKKIYFITGLNRKYECRRQVKWIVFDSSLKKSLPKNDCNILFIPRI